MFDNLWRNPQKSLACGDTPSRGLGLHPPWHALATPQASPYEICLSIWTSLEIVRHAVDSATAAAASFVDFGKHLQSRIDLHHCPRSLSLLDQIHGGQPSPDEK